MDENRIHEKLDKIIEKVTTLEVTSAKQEQNINHHVYRTDLAEENIKLLRTSTEQGFQEIKEEIEPLKSLRNNVIGAIKWTTLVLTIVGAIIGIIKLI